MQRMGKEVLLDEEVLGGEKRPKSRMSVVPANNLRPVVSPLQFAMDLLPALVGEGDVRAARLVAVGDDHVIHPRQRPLGRLYELSKQDASDLPARLGNPVALNILKNTEGVARQGRVQRAATAHGYRARLSLGLPRRQCGLDRQRFYLNFIFFRGLVGLIRHRNLPFLEELRLVWVLEGALPAPKLARAIQPAPLVDALTRHCAAPACH